MEEPGQDGMTILRWIIRKWDVGGGGKDWMGLAQHMDRW